MSRLSVAEALAETEPKPPPRQRPRQQVNGSAKRADPFASVLSMAELDRMTFPPPTYLVDKLLPDTGITLLAGAPKAGKSYLALGMALAVAQGGWALGHLEVTRQAGVLLVSLDDASRARAQQRARQVNDGRPLPAGLGLLTESIGRGEQARDALGRYLAQHRDVGLVVLDTIQHLRADRRSTQSIYGDDVAFMALVRELSAAFPTVAFLLLTHTRKQAAEDGVAAVSGTYGVVGGTDALMVLAGDRHAPGRSLEVVNRDDAGGEYVLRFGSNGLTFLDGYDPHDPSLFLTADDAAVYQALRDFDSPAGAKDLASLTEVSNLPQRLHRLAGRGVIRRVGRGAYAI